jgi:hypothetical protein
VLIGDAWGGSKLVEAALSERFETAPGIVTKSEIKPGHKGSADFELEYAYAVNGQRYTGTEYHVQPQFVGNGYWHAAHNANPVGQPVIVYYNPDAPHVAVLVPGLRTDVLFLLWLATPFNLIMIGLSGAWVWHLRGCRAFDPLLRRCVRRTRAGWLVRPDPTSRFVVIALAMLFVVTFVGCFVCGAYMGAFDFPPPWWVPALMWSVALVAPVVIGLRESRRCLLHINEEKRALTFTANSERVTLPLEDVLGTDVKIETRKSNGVEYAVSIVSLRWRDKFDQELTTPLAVYEEPADAAALVGWLSERLHLPSAAQGAV